MRFKSINTCVSLATGYMGNRFDLQPVSLNLAPDGRQIQLETFWQLRLARQSTLKLSWLGINQPGHQAKAGPMQVVMGQWQQPF